MTLSTEAQLLYVTRDQWGRRNERFGSVSGHSWRRRRLLARRAALVLGSFKLEAILLCLIITTIAAVVWQDTLLKRSTVIDAASIHPYVGYGYGDEALEGASRATTDPAHPLKWICSLRQGYQYPMCGYELLFDAPNNQKGSDLSTIEAVLLTFSYEGSSKVLRLYIKNFDPAYSVPGRGDTAKYNRIDFPVTNGLQSVRLPLSQFGVAEWWLTQNRVPPELSQPQFDNVVSLDLQTGPGSALGTHRFRVDRIEFEGAALTGAQFYGGILGAWLLLLTGFVVFRVIRLKDALREGAHAQIQASQAAERARETARRDHLTGVLNRGGVSEQFGLIVEDSRRCRSVAVILIDADNFKLVNDQYGHAYGDEVLVSLAQILKRNVREGDIVGRWGGEEFIVVCANMDEGSVLAIADKLRTRIEHFHFGDCERITASFGTYWCEAGFSDLPALVACADIALYAAKARGRNLAVRYDVSLRTAA